MAANDLEFLYSCSAHFIKETHSAIHFLVLFIYFFQSQSPPPFCHKAIYVHQLVHHPSVISASHFSLLFFIFPMSTNFDLEEQKMSYFLAVFGSQNDSMQITPPLLRNRIPTHSSDTWNYNRGPNPPLKAPLFQLSSNQTAQLPSSLTPPLSYTSFLRNLNLSLK